MAKIDIQETTKEYFARIHRAALVLSGNPWDADDLAQETFLVLSAQADRFRGASGVYTWLYGILLNLDRRERRRLRWHSAGDHHRAVAAGHLDVVGVGVRGAGPEEGQCRL